MNPGVKAVHPGTARWMITLVIMVLGVALPALGDGGVVQRNTPSYVGNAKNMGPVEPSQTIEVSLWLNPRNRAELDALASELYDHTSPNYRHFLTHAQFAARFAPTAEQAETVRQFLKAHDLNIVRTGPSNFFVRASGTVAQIEAAFHVTLDQYEVNGQIIRANDKDPYIDSDAAPLVSAIYGLDSSEYAHPAMSRFTSIRADNSEVARQNKPSAMTEAAAGNAAASSDFFTNDCFNASQTKVFSTDGVGEFPIGKYKGTILNLETATEVGCGYTPPMIQAAYNLDKLYKAGLDGKGQTIGILTFCGSPTIENDANVFNARFGLPRLTAANFAITQIPIPSPCSQADNVEVNIDVEWAHAVAPGANINLLVAPSDFLQDMDETEFTAINFGLANVLSGSFGIPEPMAPQSLIETEGLISEAAAVTGISANFSSGDSGNNPVFFQPTVQSPADSPFSTAVGGITLALNSNNSIAWQAGWGNNETVLVDQGVVFNPPFLEGQLGGSGGGASNCVVQFVDGIICNEGYAKPSFQKALPGTARQLPDISWLADPFAGVVIAVSVPGQFPPLVWQVFGGTSVACPMFSGLWAIANQAAGAPLGQAAPYLYSLPKGAITDIVPVTRTGNVTVAIQTASNSTTDYNANQVLGGAAPTDFVSGIWADPLGLDETALVISFGTDCGTEPSSMLLFDVFSCNFSKALKTTVGWDKVTGMGVPNPTEFIAAFIPTASSSSSDQK